MLNYLESEEEVPEIELDRMHVRDNLKLVSEGDDAAKKRNAQLMQLERYLTHWKSKVEDRVGLNQKKKEVSLLNVSSFFEHKFALICFLGSIL